MTPDTIAAVIHDYAPHSGRAMFLASGGAALAALAAVYGRCLFTRSHKHLPLNWIVSIAAIAAPVPTWLLLIIMPLDPDLGETVFHDPVVVALAGIYGLAAAFRDARAMASQSRKRMLRGDPPTDD